MKRWLWLKVLLVALVIAAGYGVWRVSAIMSWVYRQNATTKGLATLDELLVNTVPDAENAALVYQQTFEALSGWASVYWTGLTWSVSWLRTRRRWG